MSWSPLGTGTGGTPVGARVQAFRDATLNIDVVGTVEDGTATTLNVPTGANITVLTANDLVLSLAARLDDAGTWTAPAGMTLINFNGTTSGADMAFGWAYKSAPPTGLYSPDVFGLSGASSFNSSAVLIALKGTVTAPTYYGVTSLPVTFGKAVAGTKKTFGQVALPITFGKDVAGLLNPYIHDGDFTGISWWVPQGGVTFEQDPVDYPVTSPSGKLTRTADGWGQGIWTPITRLEPNTRYLLSFRYKTAPGSLAYWQFDATNGTEAGGNDGKFYGDGSWQLYERVITTLSGLSNGNGSLSFWFWLDAPPIGGSFNLDDVKLTIAPPIIENGDFSDGLTGWEKYPDTTLEFDSVDYPVSAPSVKATRTTVGTWDEGFWQSVDTLEPSRRYYARFRVKAAAGEQLYWQFNSYTPGDWTTWAVFGGADDGSIIGTGSWMFVESLIATGPDADGNGDLGFYFKRDVPPIGSSFQIDDVEIVEAPLVVTQFGKMSLPVIFGAQTQGIRVAPPPYKVAVLADGPAVYYRLDETSGLPQDSSGNGMHFNQSGSDSSVPGVPGLLPNEPTSLARDFNNSGGIWRGGNIVMFNTFTIEAWIKRTRTNVEEAIVCQYNGGMLLKIMANGTIRLSESFGGECATSVTTKILDTNPHHLVVTRNGSGGAVTFYLDGVAETHASTLPADLSTSANNGFFIGSEYGALTFDGIIDEVAVYPSVLTLAQVQNHYDIATHVVTTHYSSLAFPVSFGKDVRGIRKTFGQVSFPVIFSKDVAGRRKTFGQISAPFIFGKDVAGRRKTFGQITFPIAFGKDVSGQRKAFGQIAFPIVFGKDVRGGRKTFGQVSLPITFSAGIVGRKWVYGKIDRPFFFGATIDGHRGTYGQLSLPMTFAIDVKSGRVGAHGQIEFPIIFISETSGRKTYGSIVLNDALAVYLGIDPVDAAYTDNQKVY